MRTFSSETKKLLNYLLMGGVILIGSLLDPRLPHKLLHAYWREKSFNKKKFKASISYLQKRKIVKVSETNNGFILELTKQGRRVTESYHLDDLKIKIPEKWDEKWRVIIFDIPEEKKLGRDVLRHKLKNLGFYQLQKSVFCHPYPCEKEIILLREVYGLQPFVKILIVDKLEDEKKIRVSFNL